MSFVGPGQPGPHPAGAGPEGVPAGLLRRTGALLIDLAVVAFVGLFAAVVFAGIGARFRRESPPWAVGYALSLLIVGAGPFAYFGVGWWRGATPGMRACELQVVNDLDGRRLSGPQVILRLVGAVYSVVVILAGFFWVLVDGRRRSWHDHYAGSRVVRLPVTFMGPAWGPQPAWAPAPGWGAPPPPPPGWRPGPPPAAVPDRLESPPSPPAGPSNPPPSSDDPASIGRLRSGWRALATLGRPPWTWTDVAPLMLLFIPLLDVSGRLLGAAVIRLQHGRPHGALRAVDIVAVDLAAYTPALLLLFILVRLRRRGHLRDLGLGRVSLRWIGAVLPFVLAAYVFELAAGLISISIFPNTPLTQCKVLSQEVGGNAFVAIATAVVAAPFVEELFFRGFLLRYLRSRMPVGWAVVLSSVIFSVAHFQYGQPTLFLSIFTTGLVLGAIYHYSGSIWPGVLTHGTFNLIATIQLLLHPHC